MLRRAGLLQRRREGRWVYYSVDEDALDAARDFLDQLEASMARPRLADACADDSAG